MADLQTVIRAVDELSADDLDQLYQHIITRRDGQWWIVSPENIAKIDDVLHAVHEEAARMTEADINATIDQAIAEVRQARAANRRL